MGSARANGLLRLALLVSSISLLSDTCVAQPLRAPDALLAIDHQRASVVERVVAQWGSTLAKSSDYVSIDDLRARLMSLRADQLFAATLAGTEDGLREVIGFAGAKASPTPTTRTKVLGDTTSDVVYTPVTPCRLVDTRGTFAAVYQGNGTASHTPVPFAPNEIRTYTVQGGNGVCLTQLPAGLNPSAVQLQVFGMPTTSASGDIEILPQGATFGSTATMVYVASINFNTVSTAAKVNTANNQISVQVRGGGAHIAVDVVGYFRAPSNYGTGNTAAGHWATVGGGGDNTASGGASVISGGSENQATAGWSTVAGGNNNVASGIGSFVAGINNQASGQGSVAIGAGAVANYDGCFVFGDSLFAATVRCDAPNRVVMRGVGGIFMFAGGDDQSNYTGVVLPPGAQAWIAASDRAGKENLVSVDSKDVLAKVATLPISTWNWKSQDSAIRHMGPMAQDFRGAFGLGETEKGISTVDADGVALAAIQGLNQVVQEKDAQLQAQQRRIDELETRVSQVETLRAELDAMKRALAQLTGGYAHMARP